MNKVMSAVKTFIADENGATAIEYGLIAALVAVAIAAAVKSIGTQLSATFTSIYKSLGGI